MSSIERDGIGHGVLWIAHLLPTDKTSSLQELDSVLSSWRNREQKTYRDAQKLSDSMVLVWYQDRQKFSSLAKPPTSDDLMELLDSETNCAINRERWDLRALAVWVQVDNEIQGESDLEWRHCPQRASWLSKLSGFHVRLRGNDSESLPIPFWQFVSQEFFWFCATGMKVEWMCDKYLESRSERAEMVEKLNNTLKQLWHTDSDKIGTSVNRLRDKTSEIRAAQNTVLQLQVYHANLVKNLTTIAGFKEEALLNPNCDLLLQRELSSLSNQWQYKVSQIDLDLQEWRPIAERVSQLWQQLETQAQIELIAKQHAANAEARKEANRYQAIFLFLGIVGLWAGYVDAYKDELNNWANVAQFLSVPALLGMLLVGWVIFRNVRHSSRQPGCRVSG